MQRPEHLPREGGRRELLRMLDRLAPGDMVTVTRLDRLARSTFDLFGIVKCIVDAKVQFQSLAERWAGTSSGRLMLAVLGDLADVERDLIRTTPSKGRSRTKAGGRHVGISIIRHADATRYFRRAKAPTRQIHRH
jgi:DNA invertase Pin-like site-specific DNA recombinase